jgi:hypothetical protein
LIKPSLHMLLGEKHIHASGPAQHMHQQFLLTVLSSLQNSACVLLERMPLLLSPTKANPYTQK